MAGFLKGGPRPPMRGGSSSSGHSIASRPAPHMPSRPMPDVMGNGGDGAEKTEIIHLPSGEYEVHHADGDVTKHANADEMTTHLGSKLGGGEMDDSLDGIEPIEDEEENANSRV